jgi:peptidoglycan/xylan/chitin deacetylase (PgdA/CDA1 family)
MEKYRVPYTVFVPTAFIGGFASWREDNYLPLLSAQELLELKSTGLVDFGSHTVYHRRMTSLDEEGMFKEAYTSKLVLSELLKLSSIDMFAYPHGGPLDFSRKTASVLKKAGYRLAVTTRTGSMNAHRHRYILRRLILDELDNEEAIFAKLMGDYDWWYLKEFAVSLARKIVYKQKRF